MENLLKLSVKFLSLSDEKLEELATKTIYYDYKKKEECVFLVAY